MATAAVTGIFMTNLSFQLQLKTPLFPGLFLLNPWFVKVKVGEAAAAASEQKDEDEKHQHDLAHFHVFDSSTIRITTGFGVALN